MITEKPEGSGAMWIDNTPWVTFAETAVLDPRTDEFVGLGKYLAEMEARIMARIEELTNLTT